MIAGPGAEGRTVGPGAACIAVAGPRFNCRATEGVTPAVVGAGRIGCCPVIGRAVANSWPLMGRAKDWMGRDPAIAAAGTAVAAPRLMALLTVTLVTLVT